MSPHARQPKPLQDRQRQDQQGEPLVKARQVRRRLRTSTSRPFQERLVDMAAARKEIAAALRVHRAAAAAVTMRSRDQHEQQAQWPPCDAFFSDHLRDDSTRRYHAPVLPVAPPVVVGGGLLGHLDRSLPALPLGLNLSFHGFAGSSVYDATNSAGASRNRPLIQPPPADSSDSRARSSPPLAVMLSQEGSPAVDALENAASLAGAPHMGPEGESEATSLLGWGDAAATPACAWWSDVLDQGTEGSGCVGELCAPAGHEGGDVDVASMPAAGWLYEGSGDQGVTWSGKPVGGQETHLYHQRDGEDIALPCMEIEGWHGKWFDEEPIFP
ncbi:uncharacterized protein LOC119362983 [Triticum dicoccoides]|uniref:Uncharacterized protein n=2 Tax=Triticum TaxID=4564 RepID=A0A9R1PIW6_TRITD|nr:uncharacterized protein LOC119362983 [Triticum dicoccoides]XP_044322821.1 uncharacterized protein LOC123044213 [Triticum aestivum]VAH43817.1 unnamed protein product [Triticum turgidum subsp. durum]